MYCEKCGSKLNKGICPNCNKNNVKKTNNYAIIGFVLSFFVSIAGLILSIIGLKKSKDFNDGKGLSIAGIIISSILLVIKIFVIVIAILGFIYSFNKYPNLKKDILDNIRDSIDNYDDYYDDIYDNQYDDIYDNTNNNLYEITDDYYELPTIETNDFRFEKFFIDDDLYRIGAYNVINKTNVGKGLELHVSFYDDYRNYLTEFDISKCYSNILETDELYLTPNVSKKIDIPLNNQECGIDLVKFRQAEYFSIDN